MNLNSRAWRVCQTLESTAEAMRIERIEGATGWDFGNQCVGGLEAGRILARICMSDLAEIQYCPTTLPGAGFAVQVSTDHPYEACMESQYAGWKISDEKYFAMGSGPMRVAAGTETLFSGREPERTEVAVGVLETNEFPPAQVVEMIAGECDVAVDRVCLLVARTASLAGTVQIVARSVETTMHKLMDLGFDLSRVISGMGSAPLPPIAKNDMAAIGWTNDAILYGAEVTLWVRGDDASLDQIVDQVPSSSSRDYGQPFGQIFARYDHDFYKIDPHLFSPAAVRLINLDTGHTFQSGDVNRDLLRTSFGQ